MMTKASNSIVFVGILCRLVLMKTGLFGLSERPELSTPLNAHKRLREGIRLAELGLDPYAGVLFHETPLALKFFAWLYENWSEQCVNYVFVFGDVLTAFLLGRLAEIVSARLLAQEERDIKKYHPDANALLIQPEQAFSMSAKVQIMYLLHPYVVASCAARTTTVFANLLLAAFLWAGVSKYTFAACLFLALATYQSFYPVMLIIPLILMVSPDDSLKLTACQVLAMFGGLLASIFYVSYMIMGESWTFIESTAGFILSVPELTPNMGLFWYFFTEMFEHFRVFFVCTFQINCFVYVFPLAARFKNQPYLLALSLIALTAVFKSYPSYGDVGFYMALLPTLSYLFPYMKQTFIVVNTFIATTILGPILYQLWIYNGSANANYFFAITLVFSTAQIFLITDLLFAHVKRDFYLKNGFKFFKPDDKDGPIIMLQ